MSARTAHGWYSGFVGAALILLICCTVFTAQAAVARREIVEGNPSSPVRVMIYEDLQCSDCAAFRLMLDQKLLPKYGTRVAFVHRDFPLGKHDWARSAAIAARWVYEQDPELGITIRRELLSEQNNITIQRLKPWLVEFASRNDLDPKGILASLDDSRLGALIDQERQAAVARGLTNPPTVFVGGISFVETILYEDLARAIDAALGVLR
jgi:protein-disulfide isomerase